VIAWLGEMDAVFAESIRQLKLQRHALVMKQGLHPILIGVVVGWGSALGASRLIATLLFEVQPTDPTTLADLIEYPRVARSQ
jgi:hypothetical protein